MMRLSKSRFMAGVQCPLRLWYTVHRAELAPPPDAALQAVFDTGHRVGELARERYPGGVLVDTDYRDIAAAVETTRVLMSDAAVPAVHEAAIVHDRTLTRVDILARNDTGWDLVEVKSSTSTKEHFRLDVAMQYWILVNAGVDVRHAGLLLLDREYVYPGGPYDLDRLFRFDDLTDHCIDQLETIGEQVAAMHAIASQPEPPDIAIGDQCHTPYECPYWTHCSADVEWPEHPISLLPRLRGSRLDGLVERGIEALHGIPDDYPLTDAQERVRTAIVSGEPWISPELRPLLEHVAWPLHALDFEAVLLALPLHHGMRPYDPLPFQFSGHVQDGPHGAVRHAEFLAADSTDPREPLARALLDALGERGSILVYSGYERTTIRRLAQWLPALAGELEALEPRLVDLHAIVRDHFVHPRFRGSSSIKQVLPVLVPEMSYAGMEIAEGTEAGRAWLEMQATTDPHRRQQIDTALRAYCRQDSLAMLRLRESLIAAAEGAP